MMVRFATTCDICGRRSPEWTMHPYCRLCDQHVCPACVVPGSVWDAEMDSPASCLCRACGVPCTLCDGDGFGPDWERSNCARCGGSGKEPPTPIDCPTHGPAWTTTNDDNIRVCLTCEWKDR